MASLSSLASRSAISGSIIQAASAAGRKSDQQTSSHCAWALAPMRRSPLACPAPGPSRVSIKAPATNPTPNPMHTPTHQRVTSCNSRCENASRATQSRPTRMLCAHTIPIAFRSPSRPRVASALRIATSTINSVIWASDAIATMPTAMVAALRPRKTPNSPPTAPANVPATAPANGPATLMLAEIRIVWTVKPNSRIVPARANTIILDRKTATKERVVGMSTTASASANSTAAIKERLTIHMAGVSPVVAQTAIPIIVPHSPDPSRAARCSARWWSRSRSAVSSGRSQKASGQSQSRRRT